MLLQTRARKGMLTTQARSTRLALFRNFAQGGGGVSGGDGRERAREKEKPCKRPKCKAPEALCCTEDSNEQTFLEKKKDVLGVRIVSRRRTSNVTFTLLRA